MAHIWIVVSDQRQATVRQTLVLMDVRQHIVARDQVPAIVSRQFPHAVEDKIARRVLVVEPGLGVILDHQLIILLLPKVLEKTLGFRIV